MVKVFSIPSFHLRMNTLPNSGRVLVEWVGETDSGQGLPGSDTGSPLKQTYKSDEDLGRVLYGCIFHDMRVRKQFEAFRQEHCTDKVGNRVGLRLVVDIQSSPDQAEPLLNLPWELLRDKGGWLALDPTLSITRRLKVEGQGTQSQKGICPPIRVLFAYAEPGDKRRFWGEQFANEIVDVIQPVVKRGKLEVLEHATKESLEFRIKQGFHIVHLLLHGESWAHGRVGQEKTATGVLFLETPGSPVSDPLPAGDLTHWVKQAKTCPRLVVLTACHSGKPTSFGFSGVASALLAAGVEAVVAMQAELYISTQPKPDIDLDEARKFTWAFYESLAKRPFVDDAVQAGRKALKGSEYPRRLGAGMLIFPGTRSDRPSIQWHSGSFEALSGESKMEGLFYFPGWAVPTLFLRGDGWLGQGPPESPIIWEKDGKEMVYIEEGDFYIDRFPVTRGEYRRFANETERAIPWEDVEVQVFVEQFGKHFKLDEEMTREEYYERHLPATNVAMKDALAYADWARKHIPTPDEWQQAASSGCPDGWPYPWGKELLPRRCNTRESKRWRPWPVILSEAFQGCNPAGMCDIVGNVTEWTRTEDELTFLCGGSFRDWKEDCEIQKQRFVDNPRLTGDSIGFRCAASWAELSTRESEETE